MSVVKDPNFKFPDFPVIFVDDDRLNANLYNLVSRDSLIDNHGDIVVSLSSSNTYSHGLRKMSLQDYITQWVDPKQPPQPTHNTPKDISPSSTTTSQLPFPTFSPQSAQSISTTQTTSANESFYLFGNNYDGIFRQLNSLYSAPPCLHCEKGGAKTIGIGGGQSGVSFHFHGLGFSEAIIGE
jgi:hypothetical protein